VVSTAAGSRISSPVRPGAKSIPNTVLRDATANGVSSKSAPPPKIPSLVARATSDLVNVRSRAAREAAGTAALTASPTMVNHAAGYR